MKKLFSIIVGFAFAISALAQTAEDILAKMEKVFEEHENEGVAMTVETKIPVLGTIRMKTYILGDYTRMDTKIMGTQLIIWDNGETEYTYDKKRNEITITSFTESSSEENGDLELFSGIADGYDVSIKKETADAWYIQCKKSQNNSSDDPKNMDVVVAKGTYYPVSLSTKVDGVKMTMCDLSFGVTKEQVTFDKSKYPDAKITDKR